MKVLRYDVGHIMIFHHSLPSAILLRKLTNGAKMTLKRCSIFSLIFMVNCTTKRKIITKSPHKEKNDADHRACVREHHHKR